MIESEDFVEINGIVFCEKAKNFLSDYPLIRDFWEFLEKDFFRNGIGKFWLGFAELFMGKPLSEESRVEKIKHSFFTILMIISGKLVVPDVIREGAEEVVNEFVRRVMEKK